MCGRVTALPPVRAQLGQPSHGGHRFGQLAGHLHGEGFLRRVRIIISGQVDGDGLENSLVEPFALLICGLTVKPAGVAEQQQHELKVRAHHGHVLLAGGNQAVGIMYLGQYGGLTRLEILHRDGFIEVRIDQLLLLALELDEPLVLVGEQGLVLFLPSVETGSCRLAHLVDGLLGELHLGLPDTLHLLLNLLYRDVRQVAVGATGVPAEAEEIAVDTAFTPGVAVAHPSAAAVADQRPLQVVGVPPGAVTGDTSPGEDFLHPVPGLVVNEWFVGAFVNQFAVTNLAHVIRVGQHAVHLAVVQRRADILNRGAAFQPPFLELIPKG